MASKNKNRKKEFKSNPNSGALFKNQNKNSYNHPDFTGKIVLSEELAELAASGAELQVAAWKRESKSGTNYYSLAVSEPYEGKSRPAKTKQKTKAVSEDDDFEDDDFDL